MKTQLKEIRIQAGLSQQQVAKILGCTVSAYSKYENGEREPSLSSLVRLADYYELSLDELVGHQPVMSHETEEKEIPKMTELAKLKKAFDFSEADRLGDPMITKELRSLEQFHDCLTVQDVYRKIDFILMITDCEKQGLIRAFGVSRSGYYHWKEAGDVVRKRNARIADLIMRYEIPAADSAGYRAVMLYLQSFTDDPELAAISLRRVKHIMDEFEIIPEDLRCKKDLVLQKAIGKYPVSDLPVAKNALMRKFSYQTEPCRYWCIDITEIGTEEGKLYLCAVIDLCGRYLIGHAFSEKMNVRLVKSAITAAKKEAVKYKALSEEPVLLHSDRGVQFRSRQLEACLKEQGLKASMSAPHTPDDNACIESFFASLKCEYLYRYRLENISVAKQLAERYILYYNTIRVHETCKAVPGEYWREKVIALEK